MDVLNLNLPKLEEDEWEIIAEWIQYPGSSIISLENLQSVHPAGSVALILGARYRQDKHRYNLIQTPKDRKVLNYLMDIDLPRLARDFSVRFDVPQSRLERLYRNDSDRFTRILRVGSHGVETAFDQVSAYYKERFPSDFSAAWSTFEQVFDNIADHTSSEKRPALNVIQVQGYKEHLEVAFGDLGVGFLKSLKRNPKHRAVGSEQEALSKVILDKESGLGHKDPKRGGGLRQALNAIQKLGGRFRLISRDGVAFRDARNQQEFQFNSMTIPFPGTIMAVWIPFPSPNAN